MPDSTSSERRLVNRVEAYWNRLRLDCALPRAVDIDPVELGDDWCDCFVIKPCEPPEEAVFLFVGPNLLSNAGLPADWSRAAERRLHDCPAHSMLGRSVRHVAEVLRRRAPATVAETFDENGVEVRLRCTLFPLSADGQEIEAILGAANCARADAAGTR